MSYKDLYRFIQDQPLAFDLALVRQKIGDLLPGIRARILGSKLDPAKMLGYYMSPRNPDIAFFPGVPAGAAIIVICDALDEKWARYVQLKELMHLFDSKLYATTTEEELESLLSGLCDSVIGGTVTPQAASEYMCMWMALGLTCPEQARTEFQTARDNEACTDAEISDSLKLPERMVPALFSPNYKTIMAQIFKDTE